MNLQNILKVINTSIKSPAVSNGGYSIDVFAPQDLFLIPNAHISIKSGFALNLPEPLVGLLATKVNLKDQFMVTTGQLIYPNDDVELNINLKYIGLSEIFIHKDEPLFQIVILNGVKFND